MLLQRTIGVAVGLLLLMPALATAQLGIANSAGGISTTATEKVPLKPEKLRLTMFIKSQGADAKAAVVALSEHKERVQKELEAMKAEKSSVVFSPTRIQSGSGDSNNEARMMQYQMMRSAASGGGSPARKPMPAIYTATCALTAEWLLPVKEGDALAVLPVTLRDQITARDLAGEKNKPKLSKAEQEQLEELQSMMQENFSSYSSGSENSNLRIEFTAPISDEVKQKATQAAFKKAVKEAEALSTSAGIPMGKLVGLNSMTPNTIAESFYGTAYARAAGGQMTLPETGDGIASAANADELAFNVSVTVTYAMQ